MADGDSVNTDLDPDRCIKQEQDSWTATNMETQSLIPSGEVKEEPDYEVQTVIKEANGGEERYMFLVTKRASASSTSLYCPEENSFLYCEKCQQKYEGGCPEHGAVTFIDNAEADRDSVNTDLDPDGCIKQEHDSWTATNMETQSLIPSGEIKEEPDYEVQTVIKEANGGEERYMFLVTKRASASSTSLYCPEENSFLYCEKCQQKYEGGCPEHGAITFTDNAEEGQGQGYRQDSSPQINIVDKDRQVLGREKVEQSKVCEDHNDDVGTLPNGGCNTVSDEMFSVCEMKTELCVAGTSSGLLSNVELKAVKNIHNTGKLFSCDVCGVGFVESRALKTHMRTHTGEKPYKCDVCGFGCSQQSNLKIHKRTHTGEKPYKCDVCDLRFSRQRNLKIHMRTHTGEKPYKCDVCGLGFSRNGNLKIHKRTHTGEKPYKCDVCGLGFTMQGNLKIHKRTHTGEKPYKCDVCGLGFTVQGNLKIHKRTHTGEKPYRCDVCGMEMSQENSLKIHKRTHTGEKPTGEKSYKCKCDVCGLEFTLQSNLKRHERTHTGEKPYKCDVCGLGFTRQGHIKRHKRTHTGE